MPSTKCAIIIGEILWAFVGRIMLLPPTPPHR